MFVAAIFVSFTETLSDKAGIVFSGDSRLSHTITDKAFTVQVCSKLLTCLLQLFLTAGVVKVWKDSTRATTLYLEH